MSKKPKNILLVEDDLLIAMNQSRELKAYGYNVIHVAKGQQALTAMKQKDTKIDLILMDINLGEEKDGTEIAEMILREYDIPLLFLSGHTERDVVTKTENITFYGYVVKLSGIIVLDASIKMAFRLHEAKQKLKKQTLELKESEKRYRRLFESAQDGILILDFESGKIVDVNPYLVELLGYSKEEFLEKNLWDISAFKNINYSKHLYGELQGKEYIRYENIPLETHNNKLINVEFVSNVYFVDHKKVIQCNIRDITARVIHEKTLTDDILKKATLIRELQHRSKNSFSLIASLIMLRSSVESPQMINVLSDLASRVRAIADLYLVLYETESVYEVDLKIYLNKVITSMSNFTKNINFNRIMDDITISTKVASTIGMILVELLTNCIKYAFPDSTDNTINVELKKNNSLIQLNVEDNGIGMPKDLKISQEKTLGLYMVNLLVKDIDGKIKFILTKGTRIEIEFPIS
ncbi:MAG TPA: PAS domain S-box protein [Ignavibacteriaceae bacterium]|nr:PAS domain S-box protein [Ignavibacteriaceae bacterium]